MVTHFHILDTPSGKGRLQNHSTKPGLPTDFVKVLRSVVFSVFSYILQLFSIIYNCCTPVVICGKPLQFTLLKEIPNK